MKYLFASVCKGDKASQAPPGVCPDLGSRAQLRPWGRQVCFRGPRPPHFPGPSWGAMNGKWLLISLVAPLRSKVKRKVTAEICKREVAAHSEGVCVLPWGQAVAAGPSFRLANGVGAGEGRGGRAAVFTLGETWGFLA